MAQDYTQYLAAQVLNEQQLVSYRTLSRALKVHSNQAKQMLYDFHSKHNSKKPGCVHATYLLTGTKRPTETNGTASQTREDEDSVMQSSPPMPSSSIQRPEVEAEEMVPRRSIMLVKEEHLDDAKALFDEITGIHIYSLQSTRVSDMQVLTECNRKVAVDYASEDPLLAWKQYGTIQNPHVRRRTRKGPPPSVTAAPAAKDVAAKSKPLPPTAKPATLEKQASAGSKDATPEPSKKAPAATKRQNSDIFKSFAKGAAKPKRSDSQTSAAISPPAAKEVEDVAMGGFSDDEGDEDGGVGLPDEMANVQAPGGKSKKERQEELEAMMDQEDEPMEDAAELDDGTIDKPATIEDEPKEAVTVVENGRRRGRRRIMKKKTVKDEEGYLVTREEAAWESFSEEEPVAKKAKGAVAPKPATAGNKKGAGSKSGAKGNIMSFFSKK